MKCTTLIDQIKPGQKMDHFTRTEKNKNKYNYYEKKLGQSLSVFFEKDRSEICDLSLELWGTYYHPNIVLMVCEWLDNDLHWEIAQVAMHY